MRLLLCPECMDIINLVTSHIKTCSCGNCSGIDMKPDKDKPSYSMYICDKSVVPLEIDSKDLLSSTAFVMDKFDKDNLNEWFKEVYATVVSPNYSTFKKISNLNSLNFLVKQYYSLTDAIKEVKCEMVEAGEEHTVGAKGAAV